ncbi:uncharacterized protein Dwil_GK21865 [Drosophila willistoni]|uniref:GK21865 n=1 Tax=Drosophila willistoni TaxID=7260 RepID=B4MQF6_DROWI|nr:uncharacterized protein LOC6640319 [Drosophila willistoni]EDW74345.1 uncharacterized protein Dwil_GK21865 [Drosophila willistoni]
MELGRKILFWILPIFLLLFLCTLSQAYLHSVRMEMEEIPFAKGKSKSSLNSAQRPRSSGIHLISSLEHQRTFLHIFHVPYIICFYAAKGKWPYVPGFMKSRVDVASRSFFNQNDSFIKQFCTKWIQVKECFRPLFDKSNDTINTEVETLDAKVKVQQNCDCDKLLASTEPPVPVVYFDKNYIGNVSSDTILNTIEFLESFLPPPTKKQHKRKNRVRGRLDEIDID